MTCKKQMFRVPTGDARTALNPPWIDITRERLRLDTHSIQYLYTTS